MTNTFLVTDDDGTPSALVDVDTIHAAGTRLALDLAAAANNPDELDRITTGYLARHGVDAFGYVVAAALRSLVRDVLDPVLTVTDALHTQGLLTHDLRAGLADAARNAKETLT